MIPFHPLANIFPLIEGQDFDDLVKDIATHGLREPIMLLNGAILDGRNRYRACVAAKVLPDSLDKIVPSQIKHLKQFVALGDPAPGHEILLAYVLSKNLHRRQLDESQRGMVAAKVANLKAGDNQYGAANLPDQKPAVSQSTAAKMFNISERTVRDSVVVEQKAAPELRTAVEQGYLAVSVAAKATSLPAEDQIHIAEQARAGQANAARTVIKQKARSDKERELSVKQTALPDKRYGVILADPEWRFEVYSRDTGMDRSADNHYPTSATDAICARPVQSIAADDCVLFLWATVPMLPDALKVMAAWGFDYKSHCIWCKDKIGTGYWFRNQHELLLVGTRGKPPAPAMGTQFTSVNDGPVGQHSEKPASFYAMIETYFPTLPKIELNARNARFGWDSWGNEAPATQGEAA